MHIYNFKSDWQCTSYLLKQKVLWTIFKIMIWSYLHLLTLCVKIFENFQKLPPSNGRTDQPTDGQTQMQVMCSLIIKKLWGFTNTDYKNFYFRIVFQLFWPSKDQLYITSFCLVIFTLEFDCTSSRKSLPLASVQKIWELL